MKSLIIFFSLFFSTFLFAQKAPKYSLKQLRQELHKNLLGDAQKTAWSGLEIVDPKNDLEYLEVVKAYWMCVNENGTYDQKHLWLHQLDSIVSRTSGRTQMILASWAYENLYYYFQNTSSVVHEKFAQKENDTINLKLLELFSQKDYHRYFQKYAKIALRNNSRGKSPLNYYDALMLFKDHQELKYLEDLLLQRHLNFPFDNITNPSQRVENYNFDDQYWSTKDAWENDSLSTWILIQQRKSFHQIENNVEYALDYYLKALGIIARFDPKSDHYANALKEVIHISKSPHHLATAMYELAWIKFQLKDYKTSEVLLRECLQKYPHTKGSSSAQNLLNEITSINVQLDYDQRFISGTPSFIQFSGRNLNQIQWEVQKVDASLFLDVFYRFNDGDSTLKNELSGTSWVLSQVKNENYIQQSTIAPFPYKENGLYLLIGKSNQHPKFFKVAFVQINSIDVLHVKQDEASLQVWNTVENSIIPKASINLLDHKKSKKIASLSTNENGIALLPTSKDYYDRNNYILQIETKDQIYFELRQAYEYNSKKYKTRALWEKQIQIFTDRNLYRPGDTLHFKTIVYEENRLTEEKKVIPELETTIYLKNPNYQRIDTIQLTSNEFGSSSAYFILPKNGLNGQFRLEPEHFYRFEYVKVENYKRPQLKIDIENIKEAVKQGDSVQITVSVKKYNGVPLRNTEVILKAGYQTQNYWYYSSEDRLELQYADTLISDHQGQVHATFFLPENENLYQLKIHAIASAAGEVQEEDRKFDIDTTAYVIQSEHPKAFIAGTENITFRTLNRYYEEVATPLSLKIYSLNSPDKIKAQNHLKNLTEGQLKELEKQYPQIDWTNEWDIKNWKHHQLIVQENWDADATKSLDKGTLPAGVYKVITQVHNESTTSYIIVHPNEKEITLEQALAIKATYDEDKDQVRINITQKHLKGTLFLSYHWNGAYHLEAIPAGKKTWTKTLKVTDTQKNASYNFIVYSNYTGRTFTQSDGVYIPENKNEFAFKWISFRDEMVPGTPQQITLQIKRKEGAAIPMEMIAAMYDASLDAISGRHTFRSVTFKGRSYFFNQVKRFKNPLQSLSYHHSSYPYQWFKKDCRQNFNYFKYQRGNIEPNIKTDEIINFYPLQFKCDSLGALPFNYYRNISPYQSNNLGGSIVVSPFGGASSFRNFVVSSAYASMEDTELYFNDFAIAEEASEELELAAYSLSLKKRERIYNAGGRVEYDNSPKPGLYNDKTQQKNEVVQNPKIRTQLGATAFFIPHILKDDKGNYNINFQAPEALSSWHLNVLAHSKTMHQLSMQKSLQTLKDVMVQIQPPRFLRYGDETQLPVQIFNEGTDAVEGKYQISFYDENQNIITQLKGDTIIPAKGQLDIYTSIIAPQSGNLITMEASFSTTEISDGERRLIPLINNQVVVKKSKSIYANEEGTKNFAFADYITSYKDSGIQHQSYQVTFTTNPIWNVLQSLPYLMEYPHECAEQTFHRWYANQLSSHIIKNTPEIAKVFAIWEAQGTEKSPLRSNEDLKNIVLAETPWVLEAQSEEEQRAYIADLMNSFKLQTSLNKNFNQLNKFQKKDGGFPWFKGMKSSYWVTKTIVDGLLKLNRLGVINIKEHPYENMIENAYSFLSSQYLQVEKQAYAEDVDFWVIAAQMGDQELLQIPKIQELTQQHINTYVKKDFETQAKLALLCHYLGDETKSKNIFNSLWNRKHFDPEMGYYWKEKSLDQRTHLEISRQNALIETAYLIGVPKEDLEKAQWWLLNQKRNQRWENTVLTAQSIFSLMLGKSSFESPKKLKIYVGDEEIVASADNTSKSTGYYQKKWTGEAISQELGAIKIEKSGNTPIWGGLHWTYVQKGAQVSASSNKNINIQRQYYVENAESQWIPIAENQVEKGQKVKVVLKFQIDRHMEYLHISDPRPATFEPIVQVSGYQYQRKRGSYLGYYQTFKDASHHFFIDALSEGSYEISYEVFATYHGTFSAGPASIECMYNPDFKANGDGGIVRGR